MEIAANFALILFFPNSNFFQVYFEAVANAFDAGATEIEIEIISDSQINPQVLEIRIKDNGVGFSDERFRKFCTLDEPTDAFHKGLGRLVFLRYFSSIQIISTYGRKRRTFTYSPDFTGKSQVTDADKNDKTGTQLVFTGFKGERLKSHSNVTPEDLKPLIIEQFLPLLNSKNRLSEQFKIIINLEVTNHTKSFLSDHEEITGSDIPEFNCIPIENGVLDSLSKINLLYRIFDVDGRKQQLITAICIDGRTIPMNLLQPSAIPNNRSAIFLFESEIFDGKSDTSRQRLILPDTIPVENLYRAFKTEIARLLNSNIPEIEERNIRTHEHFESIYPHLIGFFDESSVGIINKDEAIEIAQRRFLKAQKEVLESDNMDNAMYEKSLEVSSRTLMAYILYREFIIKKLRNISKEGNESDIHNLIIPRFTRFTSENLMDGIYTNNAWLLDDKYMSFRTILSEGEMERIIAEITLNDGPEEENGRPDIAMIFSADPHMDEKVDVVVIEIKKRTANERENAYIVHQLINRANKLVDFCPNIQRMWYFGILEINESLSRFLSNTKWTPLFSKGRVFYQDFTINRLNGESVLSPTCLLSYDAIIEDAAARNHTFLEIMKTNMKRVSTLSKHI